jgi:RHS repeat-associated protein
VTEHLGSTRMVIDKTGSLAGIKRHDFCPFGEELGAGIGIRSETIGYSGDSVRQKFGTKERDSETGLDYFGARYYGSVMGRFLSPDRLFADQFKRDPQSWNLYAYVRNNPLRYIDPLGLARVDANGNWMGDFDGEYDKQTGLYWNQKQGHWESQAEFRFRRGEERLVDRIRAVFHKKNWQSRFGNADRTGARGMVGLAGAIAIRPGPPQKFAFSGMLLFGAGLAYLVNHNNAAPPLLIDPNIEARKKDLKLVDYIADKYGVPRDLLSDLIHWEKHTSGRGGADNLGKERIEEIAKELADELKKLGDGEGEGEGKPDN